VVTSSTPRANPHSSKTNLHPSKSSGAAHATNTVTPAAVTAQKSGGLSTGGIAGIVIGVLVLFVAIVVLFMRARSKRMREKKRATWGAAIFPKSEEASETPANPNPIGSPPPAYTFQEQSLAPPPMSYDSTGGPATSPTSPNDRTLANVRCTFVPNLPDELSITTGEVIHILSEYDDGWALCENARGEQGMVPLECLEKNTTHQQRLPQGGADWRNAQRASSLLSNGQTRY